MIRGGDSPNGPPLVDPTLSAFHLRPHGYPPRINQGPYQAVPAVAS